jgi:hypothetical protein
MHRCEGIEWEDDDVGEAALYIKGGHPSDLQRTPDVKIVEEKRNFFKEEL